MIVVDASVLTNAFTDDGPLGRAARDHLARDTHWVGPGHLLVETFSAIRGRWLGGSLGEQRATEALIALEEAEIELVTVAAHLPGMWELRSNVSGYDAAYVALAEHLTCPLVTADRRLTRVPGLRCDVHAAVPPPDHDERRIATEGQVTA